MTDTQIDQRIAEALNADEHWMLQKNYCTDLNAMHDAEKTLTSAQLLDYVALLFDSCYEATLATARQRAEAFLRALGKWEVQDEDTN
jgi:hypothetical protein